MAYTGPTFAAPLGGLSLGQHVANLRNTAIADGPSNPFHAAATAPIDDPAAISEWNQYMASQFPEGIPQASSEYGKYSHVPGLMREIQNAIDQGFGTTGGRIRQVMRLAPAVVAPERSYSVAGILQGRGPGIRGLGLSQSDADRARQLGLPEETVAAARAWAAANPLPDAGGFNNRGYSGSGDVVEQQLLRGLPLSTAQYFGDMNTQGLVNSGITPDGSGGLGALALPLGIAGAAFGLPALSFFTGAANSVESGNPLGAITPALGLGIGDALFGGTDAAPASQNGPTVAPYGDNPVPPGSIDWNDIGAVLGIGGLLGAGVAGATGSGGGGTSGSGAGTGQTPGSGQNAGQQSGGQQNGGGGSNLGLPGLPSGDVTVNSEGLMNFGGTYRASPLQGPPRALRYFDLETNPYAPFLGGVYGLA